MKKILFIFGLVFFFLACDKQTVNSDDNDFVADEVVEFQDTSIDERSDDDTPIYQSEADNRIDNVTPMSGTVSDLVLPENNCPTFRYGSYFPQKTENRVAFVYANDNLKNITVSDGVVKGIKKDTRNSKIWYFTFDSMTKNLAMVYFTFQLNNNSITKGIRFLNHKPDRGFYGTSKWGRMVELETLGLSPNLMGRPMPITAAYIPKLGDVLYFGDREGVITKEYPKTKKGQYKFKVTEWNSKCTGRRMTSSRLLTDVTKIVSGNQIDTATRFAR